LRNAVAVAEAGRKGEARYLGEVDTSEAATRKLVTKLAARHSKLTLCYDAGPTGYGLQRLIASLWHACLVLAPSLIPKKSGDRVKTNWRDAEDLATLLRAGELTRARDAACKDLTRKPQRDHHLVPRREHEARPTPARRVRVPFQPAL
jgi:transposase